MTRKRYLSLLIICLLGLAACKSNNGKKFHVSVQIDNMPSQRVILRKVGFKNFLFVDSTHSDENGHFELTGIFRQPALYNIKMGSHFLILVIDHAKIALHSNWQDLKNQLTITGSPATKSIHKFNNRFRTYRQSLMSLRLAHDSLMKQSNTPDSVMKDLEINMNKVQNALIAFTEGYADTSNSLPVAIYAASNLLPSGETDYLNSFANHLDKRFPDNNSDLFHEFKQAVSNKVTSMKANQTGPAVGTPAPDFMAKTLGGQKVSLSDFKGKYILLDFWASWCPPCRAENPNVVKAYNIFKNRNFTIVSFSLDRNHKKWRDAVKNDHLTWIQISDLKYWQSPIVSKYGIEAIPMNFLINPEGQVIARNLRGSLLVTTLEKTLPQQGQSANMNSKTKQSGN